MFDILNTKRDYLMLLESNPEKGKLMLQRLLQDSFSWFDVAILDKNQSGINDDTHRIIGDVEKIQQEYRQDENSRLFIIGFTPEEVEDLING